jgi:hypothetical protein
MMTSYVFGDSIICIVSVVTGKGNVCLFVKLRINIGINYSSSTVIIMVLFFWDPSGFPQKNAGEPPGTPRASSIGGRSAPLS